MNNKLTYQDRRDRTKKTYEELDLACEQATARESALLEEVESLRERLALTTMMNRGRRDSTQVAASIMALHGLGAAGRGGKKSAAGEDDQALGGAASSDSRPSHHLDMVGATQLDLDATVSAFASATESASQTALQHADARRAADERAAAAASARREQSERTMRLLEDIKSNRARQRGAASAVSPGMSAAGTVRLRILCTRMDAELTEMRGRVRSFCTCSTAVGGVVAVVAPMWCACALRVALVSKLLLPRRVDGRSVWAGRSFVVVLVICYAIVLFVSHCVVYCRLQ